METDSLEPYLDIIEQPIDKFRFRYKTEMSGTHGSLTGASTNKLQRTFPKVRLHNFTGTAIIRCSLFQVDTLVSVPHVHSLIMRKENDVKDPHDVEVSFSCEYIATFQGMGIIQTAKKDCVDELHKKLINRMEFEDGRDLTKEQKKKLWIKSKKEAKDMDLNKVCLHFEAFKIEDDKFISICEPVLSNSINNSKNVRTGELKITRLSSDISEAGGDEDLFLFVEKVGKNIKVRFFETDENDKIMWEDWGKFAETDVHHQYAIALRTPPYKKRHIEENINCWIQLFRPSDECYSDPWKFRYKPRRITISRKRARISIPSPSSETPKSVCEPPTISEELNTPAKIDDVIENDEMMKLMEVILGNENLELDQWDLLHNIDDIDSLLRTDSADIANTKERNAMQPELLIPLMQKIILTNSNHVAVEKLKSLSSCAYVSSRFVLDVFTACNPAIFKNFSIFVEQLDIAHMFSFKKDRQKSFIHMVCENCPADMIFDIVPTLIGLGADPNITDEKGDTVLHVLIRDENLSKCIDLFLENTYPNNTKLNLEIQNDDGMTPLILAARLNRVEIVQKLLNAGASINEVHSKDGNNILHLAVNDNSEDLVAFILNETTIDVTKTNSSGRTPIKLALAANPQNLKILHVLRSKHDQPFQLHESSDDSSDDSDSEIDGDRFELMNLSTKTELKTQPRNRHADDLYFVDNRDNLSNTQEDIFDEICLKQLCKLFNRSDKWRKLARCMNLEYFMNVCAESDNPSEILFKFSEVQGTNLEQITDIFKQLNESAALIYIDEMLARRLENE